MSVFLVRFAFWPLRKTYAGSTGDVVIVMTWVHSCSGPRVLRPPLIVNCMNTVLLCFRDRKHRCQPVSLFFLTPSQPSYPPCRFYFLPLLLQLGGKAWTCQRQACLVRGVNDLRRQSSQACSSFSQRFLLKSCKALTGTSALLSISRLIPLSLTGQVGRTLDSLSCIHLLEEEDYFCW